MFSHALLIAHIVVLGYWLGSELVINSTYRYVSWSSGMPFAERNRLMDHVMDVDQHVRYALVLQAGGGTMLAALYGYFPGGDALAWAAAVAMVAWLAFVELTHHRRSTPAGLRLAAIDRGLRYVAIAVLGRRAALALSGRLSSLPGWYSQRKRALVLIEWLRDWNCTSAPTNMRGVSVNVRRDPSTLLLPVPNGPDTRLTDARGSA